MVEIGLKLKFPVTNRRLMTLKPQRAKIVLECFMVRSIWACLVILSISLATLGALRGEAQNQDQDSGVDRSLPSSAANSTTVPEDLVIGGREVGHRVESRDGETCITCGKPITKHDVTYRVEGQRVAVHKGPCLGALAAKPIEWLSELKPHGAFLDATAANAGLSSGWLFFGSYILLGLIFGALAAHRALSVGREPLTWLFICFITNVFGYAVLLLLPRQEVHALAGVPSGLGKVAATYSPEVCTSCGAENHPAARVCSGCGGTLTPHIVSEVQRAGLVGR